MSHHQFYYLKKLIYLVGTFSAVILVGQSFANPQGGSIAAGNITIQHVPSTTIINQSSSRGIINWQSFNINKGELTHFNQPFGGVTLNRISPLQGVSQIYGRLTATGKIILINPAGIYFGPSAYVNVGGLIASTAGLSDKDFMAGNYHFIQDPRYNGAIVNQGTLIAANHGLIALMGNAVQNDGTIEANLGNAVLGSGREFSLTFAGNDNISFTVNSGSTIRAVDKNGNSLVDGVRNNGRIVANGGRIIVSAQAASGVLDNVINMRGYVEAKSVNALPGGGVELRSNGTIRVASNINVSSANFKANNVVIEAPTIILEKPTLINASGPLGGGNITIGRTADTTLVQPGVTLLAKAISGNGGLIETSGHNLTIDGINVDTRSVYGKAGEWLLDPTDFTINSATAATIVSQLNSGNVTILTTSSGTGGNGDIIVASNLLWSSANNLTLSAYRNISINSLVGIGSSNTSSRLTLKANNTGAFNIASGGGLVTKTGTINHSGPVDIFYNPTSTAYNPTTYANAGQNSIIGPVTAYMYINNANQLNILRNNSALWSRNFALSTDIGAGGLVNFTPIGNTTTAFSGKFNGLGHNINSLNISSAVNNTGIFGVTSSTAVINNITLYVNNIVGTTNVGQLVGNNAGTIDNITVVNGKVSGTGSNIGGIVGLNTGTITNVANFGAVIGTGVVSVGGIVGRNNATGIINKALSAGLVLNGLTVGGIVGTNLGSVLNSFWDTGTTGRSIGVGSNSGTFSATAGCFAGGACANGGTANLSTSSTYTNAGWDFTNTWGIISGTSYPYPLLTYSTTPVVISGQIGQYTNYFSNSAWSSMAQNLLNPIWSSFTGLNLANQRVDLMVSGPWFDSTYSNANGTFYFLEPRNYLPAGALLLSLGGSSNKGNTITGLPSNTSLTNLPIALNFVNLVSNGTVNRGFDGKTYFSVTTNLITAAFSNFSPSDMLYTLSNAGKNVIVNNGFNFITDPRIDLELRGNLSTTNGSLTINGLLDLDAINSDGTGTYNISTINSGNLYIGKVNWSPGSVPNLVTLNLTSADNLILSDNLVGFSRDVNGNLVRAGNLNVSAAFTAKSITPLSGVNINLNNFNLVKGKWYQDTAIVGDFNISNSFSINSAIMPSSIAEFIRVSGGVGTAMNPYRIVDVYGLQGIGSTNTTLAAAWLRDINSFFFVNTILKWNNGAGFVPIGNMAHPFTGSFNGNAGVDGPSNDRLNAITIYRPNEDNVGVFGVTGPTAHIYNIAMQGVAITGRNNVGFVGYNQGTLDDISIARTFIVGNNNIGIFAGTNIGSITNVSTFSNRLLGNINVGGVAGINAGNITNAIIANYLAGSSQVGGLAGLNTGTIRNSFWDTDVTGQKKAAGVNSGILNRVYGGCLNGFCSNGGFQNLSNPRTYKTVADGGLGLVSQSWDQNIWGINAGYSYPYLKAAFVRNGVTARVISGTLSPAAANEIIAQFSGVSQFDLNNLTITTTSFYPMITGADGSFYNLVGVGDNIPTALVATGGNINGSIAFKTPVGNIFNPEGNVNNLTITTTPNPNAQPTNNLALNYVQVVGLFEGLTLDQIYAAINPLNASGSNTPLIPFLFQYQSALSQYINQNASGLYSGNYYYMYSGGAVIKVYTDVDSNIRDIMKNLDNKDIQLLNSYNIKPILPAYCGV